MSHQGETSSTTQVTVQPHTHTHTHTHTHILTHSNEMSEVRDWEGGLLLCGIMLPPSGPLEDGTGPAEPRHAAAVSTAENIIQGFTMK